MRKFPITADLDAWFATHSEGEPPTDRFAAILAAASEGKEQREAAERLAAVYNTYRNVVRRAPPAARSVHNETTRRAGGIELLLPIAKSRVT